MTTEDIRERYRLLDAIDYLASVNAVVQFGEREMKVRVVPGPWLVIRSRSLIDAAIAVQEPAYVILERPDIPRDKWVTHVLRKTKATRCDAHLAWENWERREISTLEYKRIENLCWQCRYVYAPGGERRMIEAEQGVAAGKAVRPPKLREPEVDDDPYGDLT